MKNEAHRRVVAVVLISTGIVVFAAFHGLGIAVGGYRLGLGSVVVPQPAYLMFLLLYTVFACVGVLALAFGLNAFASNRGEWEGWDERTFLTVTTVAGVAIPAALRLLVLRGAPLTDDEGLYRFSAELLLSGRLSAPSHPLKLFFDHGFLVNDGRMFAQYFMGWPAILAPGVLIGMGGYVNALLSGLTVPGIYLLAREFVARQWAQVAVVLFLASPMLQVAAATQLSHTSELAALTWCGVMAMRAARAESPAWRSGALGLAFSVAFFIRPLTAVGIGAPFLVHWGCRVVRKSGGRARALTAFAVPSVVFALLFLWVNIEQTGSPWRPAYVAFLDYAKANAFRFSGLTAGREYDAPNMRFSAAMFSVLVLSMFRFNFALFGWPTSFLFVPFAVGRRRTGVVWASMFLFAALHLPLKDGGIDSFGPVHFTEMALPVVILSAVGLGRLQGWVRRQAPGLGALPVAALLGLLLASCLLYSPYRLRTLSELGKMTRRPTEAVEALPPGRKLVFIPFPFARACLPGRPVTSRHFVHWWPVNDPDFRNDVLWANHLDVATDRLLATQFPAHEALVARWTDDCGLDLLHLDAAEAAQIPNGLMRIEDDAIIRFDRTHDPTGHNPHDR